MIKIDLARTISEKLSITQKEADALLTAFMDAIGESLEKGEKVQLAGFGAFGVRYVPGHQGRNPKTGEVLPAAVPASYYPTFKAGKGLKERVAKAQLVPTTDTASQLPESTAVNPEPARKRKARSAS